MAERPGYLPIGEHAIVGDMHTAALVGSDGTVDWYCPGRFDAPSVFASLLDRRIGGHWSLAPEGADAIGTDEPGEWTTRQLYLADTAVLLTRFSGHDGVVEVTDFMPVDGVQGHRGLVRRVHCVRGEASMRSELAPAPDYARAEPDLSVVDEGVRIGGGQSDLVLATQVELEVEDHTVVASWTLSEGDTATFMLLDAASVDGAGDDVDLPTCDEELAQQAFEQTVAHWRDWMGGVGYDGRWQEVVRRSALTLKLLTYAPTGAIVAAPTTSLPERIGGDRNWDYRYVWIRDAAFSLYGLLRLGVTDEAEAFMAWLTDRVRDDVDADEPPLQVIYTLDGDTELPEEELDHLEGYRESAPVRVGNGASAQLQLDIYGELVDSIYLADKYGSPLYARDWENLVHMVDWVCEHWDQPDEGIWETRGGRKEFTHSRLMCWVAIERAMRVARSRGLPADLARWGASRDEIYHALMDDGYDEEVGAFTQALGSDTLDAAVLLMPLVKFISPTDPLWLSTLAAIEERLVSDSLVYRYDPEDAPDGVGGEEGTFSMCTFWYVEALARAGRVDEARLVFDKMLTYANPVGLYAEQIGPRGELLGNFPQAFTHLALISAAFNLDRALDAG